jgi:hypothetical protein
MRWRYGPTSAAFRPRKASADHNACKARRAKKGDRGLTGKNGKDGRDAPTIKTKKWDINVAAFIAREIFASRPPSILEL